MASAARNSRSSGSSTKARAQLRRFVVCVSNEGSPASLELRKLYLVVPDSKASKLHLLRVVDESGDDYLYPEHYFIAIKLPPAAERAVSRVSR